MYTFGMIVEHTRYSSVPLHKGTLCRGLTAMLYWEWRLHMKATELQAILWVINSRMETAKDADDFEVIMELLKDAAKAAGKIAKSMA